MNTRKTPKGKPPSLISGSNGHPEQITVKALSRCARCKAELVKGVDCMVVPVASAGHSNPKRYCSECFSEILNQTEDDLKKIRDIASKAYQS